MQDRVPSNGKAVRQYQDIEIGDTAEHVRLICINRPDSRNALRTPCLAEIANALQDAEREPQVRAVVITGSDKVFAAGADIRELLHMSQAEARQDRRPHIWRQIQQFSKPLISVVRGYALGAGCELALLSDIVVAADNARFGQPEVTLGIIPGAGGIQRLTRQIGKSAAAKMILTGELIDAHTAKDLGIVVDVKPLEDALDYGLLLAERIARNSPLAVKAAKQVLNRVYETTLETGLKEERTAFCDLMDSSDKREGLSAFLEKRPAKFTGN